VGRQSVSGKAFQQFFTTAKHFILIEVLTILPHFPVYPYGGGDKIITFYTKGRIGEKGQGLSTRLFFKSGGVKCRIGGGKKGRCCTQFYPFILPDGDYLAAPSVDPDGISARQCMEVTALGKTDDILFFRYRQGGAVPYGHSVLGEVKKIPLLITYDKCWERLETRFVYSFVHGAILTQN
jgi:hypothetical protein